MANQMVIHTDHSPDHQTAGLGELRQCVKEAVREELAKFLEELRACSTRPANPVAPNANPDNQSKRISLHHLNTFNIANPDDEPKRHAAHGRERVKKMATHAWMCRHMRGFVASENGNAVDEALDSGKDVADSSWHLLKPPDHEHEESDANHAGNSSRKHSLASGKHSIASVGQHDQQQSTCGGDLHEPSLQIVLPEGAFSPPEEPNRSESLREGDEARWAQSERKSKGKNSLVLNLGLSRSFTTYNSNHVKHRCPCLNAFVHSVYFDAMVGMCILLNSISIGVQTHYMATESLVESQGFFRACEIFFCCVFSSELLLRLIVVGFAMFTMHGWAWNVFDCIVVGLQLLDELSNAVLSALGARASFLNLTFIRVLRVLRVVRIIRVGRILRMIGELRTLVASIISCLSSFASALTLLMLIIYIVSVFFTQLVADYLAVQKVDTTQPGNSADIACSQIHYDASRESLTLHYGDLWRSMQTLFQAITGGVDWNVLVAPLAEISPLLTPVFMLYVAFGVLAMLNIITGVFVDSALLSARADKDICMVGNMRELFSGSACGLQGKMDWPEFERQLDRPQMQQYFKAIDVDPSEARGVFQLLDIDDSGFITAEEFLSGSIRLRGAAKALDLALMVYNFKGFMIWIQDHAAFVEDNIERIIESFEAQRISVTDTSNEPASSNLSEAGDQTPGAERRASRSRTLGDDEGYTPSSPRKTLAASLKVPDRGESKRDSRVFSVSGIMADQFAATRRTQPRMTKTETTDTPNMGPPGAVEEVDII